MYFSFIIGRTFSSEHVARLDFCGQLDMSNVMHNMTRVSAKGIVQVLSLFISKILSSSPVYQ